MQQTPHADHQIDLELRLPAVERIGQVDLDQGRTDLQSTHLRAVEEADQVDDQFRVGELELQFPQRALLGSPRQGRARQQ